MTKNGHRKISGVGKCLKRSSKNLYREMIFYQKALHSYIYTHIHILVCIHTYMHSYIDIHTYIHTYTHRGRPGNLYTYMHACVHTYIFIYIDIVKKSRDDVACVVVVVVVDLAVD